MAFEPSRGAGRRGTPILIVDRDDLQLILALIGALAALGCSSTLTAILVAYLVGRVCR